MRDLYQEITNKLISQIEANPGDWLKPWVSAGSAEAAKLPVNGVTGHEYRGINIPMLWFAAKEHGHCSNRWGTYQQWATKGGQVRKGEKGTEIVFFKTLEKRAASGAVDSNGDPETVKIPLLRSWHVFNASQVDGLATATPEPVALPSLAERIDGAEKFVAASGATVRHGGNRAFFSPGYDLIQMPELAAFKGSATATATEAYYGTLLHELTYWTGVEKRCNREFGKRFGDNAYAFEELVAELGAAFLSAHLGIASEPRADHAQYMAHWLEVMKGDKRAVFTAASKATAALDYLRGLAGVEAEPVAIAA